MTQDSISRIRQLLGQAEEAHGEYEEENLGGVYDQNWPEWYARYAVDNGLGTIIGREISAPALSRFLAESYREYKKDNQGQSWEEYTARQILGAFAGV